MADRRRNRPAAPSSARAPDGSDGELDAETRAALALFNARLAQQGEAKRAERQLAAAKRAKDDAAARVRALESDPKADADARATAAAAYRDAVAAWDRARSGDSGES
jgi:hypothetical protein